MKKIGFGTGIGQVIGIAMLSAIVTLLLTIFLNKQDIFTPAYIVLFILAFIMIFYRVTLWDFFKLKSELKKGNNHDFYWWSITIRFATHGLALLPIVGIWLLRNSETLKIAKKIAIRTRFKDLIKEALNRAKSVQIKSAITNLIQSKRYDTNSEWCIHLSSILNEVHAYHLENFRGANNALFSEVVLEYFARNQEGIKDILEQSQVGENLDIGDLSIIHPDNLNDLSHCLKEAKQKLFQFEKFRKNLPENNKS